MNLCLPYTPCLVHPLWIVTWKIGCPCVSLHVCPSCLIFSPTPCYNVYKHKYMNLCPPGCLCLVQPLCIVWWKPGCPCMAVCLCPSHLISVATHCLDCVHASGHEFMSTWLLMSGPPPKHSLMETWVPLYGSVFVSQSSHFCCHTLFRMCTYISTSNLCPPGCLYLVQPLCIVWWKPGCPCLAVCLCPSHLISVATPCLECVHGIITWIYAYLTPHVWSTPYG